MNAIQFPILFFSWNPTEEASRIPVPVSEDLELREKVDENLQDMILNDTLEILKDVEIIKVMGSIEKE